MGLMTLSSRHLEDIHDNMESGHHRSPNARIMHFGGLAYEGILGPRSLELLWIHAYMIYHAYINIICPYIHMPTHC